MTNVRKRFFIYAGILLVAVLAVSQTLFSTVFAEKSFPMRIASICVVCVVTCACHIWLINTVKEKPDSFGRVFILQTFGKILLYLLLIVGYLLILKENIVFFVFHFLFVKIIFTIFDVSLILKFVKK